MALRILMYFGLLAVGWLLRNKGLINEKLTDKISNFQTIILFGLIFVMGVRLGMDEQVVSSIGQIGIMAAVFAIVTAGFSVLLVYLSRKRFFKGEGFTGGKND